MNKLLSYKACREYLDSDCNEKYREGKTLNFRELPTSCYGRRNSFGNGRMGKGRSMYMLIGGVSVAASVVAAFIAIRERNLYQMYQAREREQVNVKLEKPVLEVKELAENFISGNRMHFLHSAAIMAAPYGSSAAFLTSCLLLMGITLYSGTQYYRTFVRKPKAMTPVLWAGGFLLFSGWLTFLL